MDTGTQPGSSQQARGSAMKVSDLAEELEVPASTVLAQCQRFGIDATWAGAELRGADIVVLRSELASSEAIDLTPADPQPEGAPSDAGVLEGQISVPKSSGVADEAPAEAAPAVPAIPPAGAADAAPAPEASLPPTAVGSMPDLLDEVAPEAEADSAPVGPGFLRPTPTGVATEVTPQRDPAVHAPKFDRSIRSSIIALVVAAAAVIGSNVGDLAIVVAGLWFIAAVALVVSVIDAFRGRRHATMHPHRFHGAGVATVVMVLAIAGLIGMTASILAVTTDDPDDVPGGLTDLPSVQTARWGYQRALRVADDNWKQPAREVGTCWYAKPAKPPRDVQRVEQAKVNTMGSCTYDHTLEVIDVFAYNREADSPYPGPDGFSFAGQEACGAQFRKIQAKVPQASLEIEYPDASGWDDGDHDVVCAVVTPERNGKLGAS